MARRARFLLPAAVAALATRVGTTVATTMARVAAARRHDNQLEPDVPAPSLSVGLAAAAALDTLLVLPIPLLASAGSSAHYRRSSDELDAATRYYDRAGWLDDSARRHPAPTICPDVVVESPTGTRTAFAMGRFESGWQPEDGEPGADRWRGFQANSVVPVRLLRHSGGPRPWLIMVHGQGMGRDGDVRMLRARRLHDELGVNVALPVLPLHGPRAAGLAPDRQFVSSVYPVNNVLGLTQAVWDVRRLLRWLRDDQQAPAVGLLGVSLGSYVANLLSTLEGDLACIVAVVPTSDLARSLRDSRPLGASRKRMHAALHDERSVAIHRVVSPLARPCLVPHSRRYIVAGQVDRIAPPAGAAELWRHWDRPSIEWQPRGHLTTWQSGAYDRHIAAVLGESGLLPPS